MNRRATILLALSLAFPAAAQIDLTVSSGMMLTLNGTSQYQNVTVESGGTIVLNGTMDVLGNFTVKGGGIVTQALGTTQSLITVNTGTVLVEVGGTIDVSSTGLLGGYQTGNNQCSGLSLNPSTFLTINGAGQYNGGSHGGSGGTPTIYGFQAAPIHRGGGGGCGSSSTYHGGNGGGAIRIDANTMTIEGTIRANGGAGAASNAGGGAGGSIYLTATTFGGTTGTISAIGGNAPGGANGGGGGRIAILAGTSTFTGTVTAAAGTGGASGAGSVYYKVGAGTFQVVGGYVNMGAGDTADSVTFGAAGVLRLIGNATITQPVTISTFGAVELATNDALQNVTLGGIIDGNLVVNAPIALPPGLILNGIATINQPVTIAGDLTVNVAGRITHTFRNVQGVQINATGLLDLRGTINANALGLPEARAIDPLTSAEIAGAGRNGGASHGGSGGAPTNAVYGSADQPTKLGSGGGDGSSSTYAGGIGGGRIQINAGTLRVDGTISADGNSGTGNAGGGSGGSVWLTANNIFGVGNITAKGGNSSNGGGGGGRVAIDYTTNTFSGVVNTQGGTGSSPGGSGTARLKSAGGALTLQNGTYVLDATSNYDSVTLVGGAWLDITGAAVVNQPIVIGAQTTVALRTSDALTSVSLAQNVAGRLLVTAAIGLPPNLNISGRITVNRPVTVAGGLTIALGGVLDHDPRVTTCDVTVSGNLDIRGTVNLASMGHPPSYSPDPQTMMPAANVPQYQGGSHGGKGCCTSRPVYDDQDAPDELGSGGGVGSSASYPGGAGGGRIKITAGTLTVDGTINVNGANGTTNGGGGAGGAVNATVTNFAGAGSITARGGTSPSGGGGGGGGRISVAFMTSTFTGVVDNAGGPVAAYPGEKGSVRLLSSAGALEVMNGYFDLMAAKTYSSVTLSVSSTLSLRGSGTITSPLTIPVGTVVRVLATDGAANVQLPTTFPGSLWIEAPFDWTGSHTVAGALWVKAPTTTGALTFASNSASTIDNSLSAAGDLSVLNGAVLRHTAAVTAMDISSSGRLLIEMGGSIDATARGLAGGNQGAFACSGTAVHPTTHASIAGSGSGSGGSYAGLGFGATPNLVYGSSTDMEYPGSGGGCNGTTAGGAGGGLIRLRGATVQIDGNVLASGGNSTTAGGGSGGGLLIVANRLEGSGAIRANGGAATTTSGGGGGGGRVRVERLDNAFTGIIEALGGTSPASRTGMVGEVTLIATPNGAPKIVRPANLFAAVGVPYRFNAAGKVDLTGTGPITLSKTSGPSNLLVDTVSRKVNWVPQAAGPTAITLGAMNGVGTDSYTFTVDVAATPPGAPTANIAMGTFSGARPLLVSFDGRGSTSPAQLMSWSWDFGDGRAPVEGQQVMTTYDECGGFIARLTVTDIYGQTATATQAVQVACNGMTPPKAIIAATRTVADGMVTVDFSCSCTEGSAPITGYQWITTDGFFSDQVSDRHVFGPGTHELQLTVVDANGLSATDKLTLQVAQNGNTPPYVSVSADPASAVAPVDVRFASDYGSLTGTISTLKWTFADGTTAASPSAQKHYDGAAQEHAVFTVTDDKGLTASAFVDVEIAGTAGQRPTVILSKPRTSIFTNEAYTYNKAGTPTVRGNPPFTFELTAKPTGASIDAMTGKITWTPAVEGEQSFSMRVVGQDGPAVQEWKVTVVKGTGTTPPRGGGCGCDNSGGAVLLLGLLPLLRRMRKTARR